MGVSFGCISLRSLRRWLVQIYAEALRKFPRPVATSERPEALWRHFVPLLYVATCRSLFDCHKLPFALTMATRLMRFKGTAKKPELSILAHGFVKHPSQRVLKKLNAQRASRSAVQEDLDRLDHSELLSESR